MSEDAEACQRCKGYGSLVPGRDDATPCGQCKGTGRTRRNAPVSEPARERIAELERDRQQAEEAWREDDRLAVERIAELEREVAEEKRLRRIDIDAMLDAESRLLAAQKAIVPVNSTAITEQKLFYWDSKKDSDDLRALLSDGWRVYATASQSVAVRSGYAGGDDRGTVLIFLERKA